MANDLRNQSFASNFFLKRCYKFSKKFSKRFNKKVLKADHFRSFWKKVFQWYYLYIYLQYSSWPSLDIKKGDWHLNQIDTKVAIASATLNFKTKICEH